MEFPSSSTSLKVLQFVLYAIYYIWLRVYNILCNVYCIRYNVYYVLSTIYFTLLVSTLLYHTIIYCIILYYISLHKVPWTLKAGSLVIVSDGLSCHQSPPHPLESWQAFPIGVWMVWDRDPTPLIVFKSLKLIQARARSHCKNWYGARSQSSKCKSQRMIP